MSGELEKAREETAAAFNEHAAAILTFCRRRLSDREAAEDIVQEAFARYWATRSRGEEIRQPRAFLYTVAGNLIKNHFRDRKEAASLDGMMADGFDLRDPDSDAAAEAREGEMMRTVEAQLGREDATILALRYVEGLELSDIGRALGKSRVAVSVRIHRALKKLKTHFRED